ncbi:MAG TPA: hypothetical protein PLL36_08585 [Candidatus Hydrogenedentes bacterium]|nr:hypothetical protein [Candidatus Hydrogenedentota bacterium]
MDSRFTLLDWCILSAFPAVSIVVGFLSRRYVTQMDDFVLAGRSIRPRLGLASIIASEMGLMVFIFSAQQGLTRTMSAFSIAVLSGLICLAVAAGGVVAQPLRRIGVRTLAEFYRRQGRHEAALRLWHGALAPPTLDIIWTKFLFWRRVACPFPAELSTLSPPPGELRPLIDFMRGLPENCLWDPVRFESGAHAHVALYGRQEVFWLRLLHALQVQNEAEALALVTLSGFGIRSWHPVLERSLARILTYRRSGYMGTAADVETSCVSTAPVFFEMLEQAAGCAAGEPPTWFMELLDGGNAFAAACACAGWKAAARRLEDPGVWPRGTPKFMRGGA